MKPEVYPEWAEEDLTEIKTINGVEESLPNKIEPTEEWKASGELYREPLPRPYINYQFHLISEWIKHLDSRYAVGDVIFTTSEENAEEISERLGGTWVAAGSDTLGTANVNVFEKTA